MKKLGFFFLIFLVCLESNAQDRSPAQYIALGDYSSALKAYKTQPDNADTQLQIARTYRYMGNNTQALIFYEKSLQTAPADLLPRYEYGKLLIDLKQNDKALAVFDKLIIEQSDNASFFYYKGLILDVMDRITEAGAAYDTSLKLSSEYRTARLAFVTVLIKLRAYKQGIDVAQVGLNAAPDDLAMNNLIAQCYYRNEQFGKAAIHFQKLLDLGEVSEFVVKSLAASYYQDSKYEKAVSYYLKCINEFNEDAGIYFMIAKCYMRLNKLEDAISYIESAMALKHPSLGEEYMTLGTIYNRQGKTKKSLDALEMACKEDPNNLEFAYQRCVAIDKYYEDKAVKIKNYEAFVKRFPGDYLTNLAAARISDLKKLQFLEGKN